MQTSQLVQLRAAAGSLGTSMGIARNSLGQLNIRAPVTGQLSGFDIQLGQSLQQGQRIGQIDSAGAQQAVRPTSTNSISAASRSGQTATIDVDGKTYRLKVAKSLSAGSQRPVPGRPACSTDASRRRSSAARPAGQADARRFQPRRC